MPDNPFLTRAANRARQSKAYHRAPKQEKDLSKRLGGRQISGSGSGKKKGDLYIENVARIEAKVTQLKSFSVTREMVDKINNASLASGELPVIVVEFIDPVSGKTTHELAIMSMVGLESLIHDAKNSSKTG